MVVNPNDFEEVADFGVAKLIGSNSYSNMPFFGYFSGKFPKGSNRVNLPKKIIRSGKRKPNLRYGDYCICESD